MSDATYTPGPWVAHPATTEHSMPVCDAEGGAISMVWGSNDEAQANARLIAAAPELLEALEGVLSAAEHAYHTAAFADPDGGDWWKRIKRARAAIAKATGESA